MMDLASNYSLSMSSRDFIQPSGKDSLFRRWLLLSQLFITVAFTELGRFYLYIST
ncbi:MAG: hypothetical protein J6Y02_10240 [Pseudobutyrivibrio sp.]|nr:hypothetical protein [Pseudobutyrivibrio sp.]